MTSDSPPNSWSGIRIKSGTLAYPRGSLFLDGTLSVAVGVELRLQVVPDSVLVPGPADGPGIASTNSDAELPTESTFVFGPLGVESIATAPARLALADGVFDLQRNNAACAYYAPLRQLLIPMTPEPAHYEANSLGSAIFALQGSAPVTSAAWALPTSINAAPANLGEAATGSLVLQIATGLQATWVTLQGNAAPAGHAVLAVNSQSLTFIAKAAVNYRGSHRLQLWRESASANSIVEATFPKPFQLLFISDRSGLDAVGTEALLSARLDRPVRADNTRFPVDIAGTLLFTQQATGTMVEIEAIPPQPPSRPIQPIALTNALISVTPPVRMFLRGTLAEGSQVTDGNLLIESLIYQILPALPDPYAADFTVSPEHDAPRQDCRLAFNVQWPDQDHPKLTINLTLPDGAAPQLFPRPVRDGVDPLLDRIGNRRPPPRAVYWMLDVSSAADQLGVSLDFLLNQPQPQQLAVADVSLEVSGVRLHTLMLPQFQWEPVQNTFNKDTGDIDKLLISNDDGGPSFVKTESVRLVPIVPAPVVAELVRAYNDDRAASHVRFTLPFGIQAFAALQAPDFRYLAPPGLKLLAAPFEDLTGARQISLTSGVTLGPQAGILPDLQPLLLGSATQTNNFAGTAPPGSTLGQLQPDFNASFNTTVPISRIDLSGYGASLFSRWVDPSNPDVGITQVGFDAFNGRTAFERVMMVSFLWPCLARVVRTIVLERQGSGTVLRWDSGWIATTPGLFTHPKFAGIHKGVVEGMHDIREIRDTDQIVTVGSGVTPQHFRPCITTRTSRSSPPGLNRRSALGRTRTVAFPRGVSSASSNGWHFHRSRFRLHRWALPTNKPSC